MGSRFLRGRHHFGAFLCLAFLPVIANALVLLGGVNPDPALGLSGLAQPTPPILSGGFPDWMDLATGAISLPLAHVSIQDWLHGVVPWWNPYTGVGMPLAAEMVGFSFFLPFLFLLKFHNGFILLRISIQVLSGWSMYALMVGLACRPLAAMVSAVLFGLSATFLLAPQAIGPLPFLPLLLLGIEGAASRAGGRQTWTAGLIAIAIAGSVYGGFPEIAYIDGLLAAVWTLNRARSLSGVRGRFIILVGMQTMLGICMALPLLVPFLGYTAISYLGSHLNMSGSLYQNPELAPAILFPYIYGPYGNNWVEGWNYFGGWLGLPATLLAVFAVVSLWPNRGLAVLLAGYVLFWALRSWGFPPAISLANLIPYIAHIHSARFCWPSVDAAVFILAGLGTNHWLEKGGGSCRNLALVIGLMMIIIVIAIAPGFDVLARWPITATPQQFKLALTMTSGSIIVGFVILLMVAGIPTRKRAGLMVALIMLDTCACTFIPQFSAARGGNVDLAGVDFLKTHLGLDRIYSLGAIKYDYPALYGLSAIDSYALPVDRSWTDYITKHLDPGASKVFFDGDTRQAGDVTLTAIDALNKHFSEFLGVGMKYVVAPGSSSPFETRSDLLNDHANDIALPLIAGQSISGNVAASVLSLSEISSADVSVGTGFGQSTGKLMLTICDQSDCAHGETDLSLASDDQFLKILLDHAVRLVKGTTISYNLTHDSGRSVAIWLGHAKPSVAGDFTLDGQAVGIVPNLRFDDKTKIGGTLVFQDRQMSIYEMAGTRPFYSTDPGCVLSGERLNEVTANCAKPATLTRLEAWYPGWHVLVNGVSSVPNRVDDYFEGAVLPAGVSHVTFSYIPNGTHIAVAAAIAALLMWLGLVWRIKKMPG